MNNIQLSYETILGNNSELFLNVMKKLAETNPKFRDWRKNKTEKEFTIFLDEFTNTEWYSSPVNFDFDYEKFRKVQALIKINTEFKEWVNICRRGYRRNIVSEILKSQWNRQFLELMGSDNVSNTSTRY